MKLRRAVRSTKDFSYADPGGYPDGPPVTPLGQLIAELDQQSFDASVYAKVDDILVQSLFGAKRRPDGYRAFKLARVFLEDEPLIPPDVALDICHLYNHHADSSSDSATIAKAAADEITAKYQDLFFEKDSKNVVIHLLARYHAMQHHVDSQIGLDKVRFSSNDNNKITAGLKAKSDIGAGTVILTASSSLSSDIVTQPSLSTIESVSSQLGPSGRRLILGPFRFANHHCNPNSQIMAIPGTHAYTICTVRNIETGEPITVKYSEDNSYFPRGQCGCDFCRPDQPPIAPRRDIDMTRFTKDPNKKVEIRRGGRRARQRRAKQHGK